MGHTIPSNSSELVYLQREPIGVMALITPWNVALEMIVGKLAPALTLGNTCIIKPPKYRFALCFEIGRTAGKL